MSGRATLLLLAVLLALAGGYLALDRLEQRRDAVDLRGRQPLDVPADAWSAITIARTGDEPTRGVRGEDGAWRIVAPLELPAYQTLWNRIAENLSALHYDRLIEDAPDPGKLAEVGLTAPSLRVTADATGETHEVVFGAAGPMQQNRYARVNEGPLVLVPEETYFELNRELDLLRPFYLVNTDDAELTRIEFAWVWQGAGGAADEGDESIPVVLVRDGGSWQMTEPVASPVESARVQEFAAALLGTVCKDFVDEPESLADYGLAPPSARVTAATADGETTTLYFGDATGSGQSTRLFAMREGQDAVFTVPGDLREHFPQTPDAFRLKRLVTRDLSTLRSMTYRAGDTRFVLTREEGDWTLTDPPHGDTDNAAVAEFLNRLAGYEAESFASPDAAALDDPRLSLTFTYAGGERAVIRVGGPAPAGDAFYATQDTGLPIVVPQDVARALEGLVPFDFRTREVLAFDADEAGRIDLTFYDTEYRFENELRYWKPVLPRDRIWESPSDMRALIDALNPVRVTLEPPDAPEPATRGLDAPVLTLRVRMRPTPGTPADELPVLRVGAPSEQNPRQRYARVEGRDERFLVRQAVLDDVREALSGLRAVRGSLTPSDNAP